MLKGFKKGSGGPDAPATERDLREEREALTALLRHLDASSAPVRALADAVTALEARVAALDTRANQAARTLSDVETAASAVGAMTGKIKELTDTVREARQTADRLTAPDGDLHQQRHLMQQLASQSLQTRNTIDTLASEQQRLEALGADLKRATEQLQQSRLLVTDTTAEIAAVRTAAEDARAAQATMRDLATRTQDDAERAVATVREIDQKLQGLTALQALVNQAAPPGIAYALATFTGSTSVGITIAQGIAGHGKALTLELGGKAANIVFDDAAIDQAVEGVINGIFFNQGEVCCAGSRLLVQESIADEFIARLRDRMGTLRVGDPMDKNTDVGAINSRDQMEKIAELVASGVSEGADLWQPACDLPARGWFFRPTLFTSVAQSHRIAREEIFGPVLAAITFRTVDEAIEKANNTAYGLSAGIWTEKGSRILDVAARLKAGVVWANTFNRFDPTAPFGGYKESGYGREGGVQGLHAYLRLS